jgi:hypothetical protein
MQLTLPFVFCRCRFQQKIDAMLAPVEVDPSDKSFGAYMKRFRNAAVKGMAHDIHADIKDDDMLQVRIFTWTCRLVDRV